MVKDTKLRFYNAVILTSPDAVPFKGEVIVRGGRIRFIGESFEKPEEEYDREIDCRGNLIMSGFCNAHAHAAMCLFRGIADDLT